MFKKMRGIRLPYIKQGLIYFTCRDYADAPREVQQKIDDLSMEIAGEYHQALRDVVISSKSVQEIADERFVHERTLYRLRKKFYERW